MHKMHRILGFFFLNLSFITHDLPLFFSSINNACTMFQKKKIMHVLSIIPPPHTSLKFNHASLFIIYETSTVVCQRLSVKKNWFNISGSFILKCVNCIRRRES